MMVMWVFLFLLVSSDAQSYDDNSQDPSFAEPIPNITVAAGSDVTFPCVVNNLGNYKLYWIHEDKRILTMNDRIFTQDSHYRITRNDFGTWCLIIKFVEVSHKGEYTCEISTSPKIRQSGYLKVVAANETELSTELLDKGFFITTSGGVAAAAASDYEYREHESPKIGEEHSSSDTVVREGDFVSLRCRASGSPTPNITWRREDQKDIQTGAKSHSLISGEYLNITNAYRLSMGAYVCIASNGVQPSVSKLIRLNLTFAPMIWIENQLIGAPLDTDVVLDCGLESFPKSVTYWKKNGGIIILSNGKYDSNLLDSGIYQSKMHLRIRNLKQEDYGTYNCVAKNALGLTEGTIKLFQHNYPTTTFSTHITGETGKTDAARKAELSTELLDKDFFVSTPGGVAAAATSDYEYRGEDAQSYDGDPFFAEPIPNITVAAGGDVILPCVVNNLGNYMLGWIHRDNHAVLTLRESVIQRDPRYSITRNGSRTWLLHIKDVQVSDKGEYMCHINTFPLISQSGYLEVVAANKAELSTELLDKGFFISTPGGVAAAATSDNEYRGQDGKRKKSRLQSRLHHNNGTRNSRMNLLFGPFSLVGVLVVVGTTRTFM